MDVTIQAQYLDLMRQIQQEQNLAMIFITHDFGIVASICTKVAVMYAGKIIEMAPVREIFNNPVHPYTRGLIASVPSVDEKAATLYSIEGHPPSLLNLPEGCTFWHRCAEKSEKCHPEEFPPEVNVSNDHKVRCWLYA